MGKIKNYWILDKGKNKTYELRSELKKEGAFWNPDHKSWKIEDLDPKSDKFKRIKKLGLELQLCIGLGGNCNGK